MGRARARGATVAVGDPGGRPCGPSPRRARRRARRRWAESVRPWHARRAPRRRRRRPARNRRVVPVVRRRPGRGPARGPRWRAVNCSVGQADLDGPAAAAASARAVDEQRRVSGHDDADRRARGGATTGRPSPSPPAPRDQPSPRGVELGAAEGEHGDDGHRRAPGDAPSGGRTRSRAGERSWPRPIRWSTLRGARRHPAADATTAPQRGFDPARRRPVAGACRPRSAGRPHGDHELARGTTCCHRRGRRSPTAGRRGRAPRPADHHRRRRVVAPST